MDLVAHLEVDISAQHLQLVPSLLWSLLCLDLLNEKHYSLISKSLSFVSQEMDRSQYLSFPGAVLLNQVINHLELESLSTTTSPQFSSLTDSLSIEHKEYIQQLAYRYEQLESKESSNFMKKMFGADISREVVRALKNQELTQNAVAEDNELFKFKIDRFNP